MTMNQDLINNLIDKLGSDDYTKFFHLAGVLADPVTRKVLAKLASPRSPISIDSIPIDELGETKPTIITELVQLEKIGLARSVKVKSQHGYCKKYFINAKGNEIVSKLMTAESKMFS